MPHITSNAGRAALLATAIAATAACAPRATGASAHAYANSGALEPAPSDGDRNAFPGARATKGRAFVELGLEGGGTGGKKKGEKQAAKFDASDLCQRDSSGECAVPYELDRWHTDCVGFLAKLRETKGMKKCEDEQDPRSGKCLAEVQHVLP